jgi:hypothetical protein
VTLTATRTTLPATQIPTSTYTPVIIPTPNTFEINNALIYPNPYRPGLGAGAYLGCDITRDAETIVVKVYTTGFRAIKIITIPGTIAAGRVDRHIEDKDIGNLASGVYYYSVSAVSTGKARAKAPPGVLVVIR